jgi:hypothetical protein
VVRRTAVLRAARGQPGAARVRDGLPRAEGEPVRQQRVAVVPLVPGAQRAVQAAVRVRAAARAVRDAVVHGVVDGRGQPQRVGERNGAVQRQQLE